MGDESDQQPEGSDAERDADDALARQVELAWTACRIGDPEAGIAAARVALAQESRHGEVWYVLGVCHERAGRCGTADRCFNRAARALIEPQSMPYRISWARFCALVERNVAALPETLAKAFAEVTLVLADYAPADLLEAADERELLGVFIGPTRSERSPASGNPEITPQIQIFRRAHEHACATREELAAEVRGTLIHELGHYLGYGEDEIESMGWG